MTDPATGGAGPSGWPPPGGQPPPPGWQPPPPPPPTYQGSPAGYAAPPSFTGTVPGTVPYAPYPGAQPLAAAHKPGAIPLRPLALGDLFDGAFRIIRFNPRATVGSAVLVAAVSMAIPVLVTAILTATLNLTFDASSGSSGDSTSSAVGVLGALSSLGLGSVLSAFGSILVTGMIARVTAAAAIGRRLSLGEAWGATRGKRWRLLGLACLLGGVTVLILALYAAAWVLVVVLSGRALVIVIWALVSVPLFIGGLCWFWVRVYYLPVPALMLEPVGILGALRRGFVLTRHQFWRTFGIALLTLVVVSIAAGFLRTPAALVGDVLVATVDHRYSLLVLVATNAIAQVISAAFVTPFTSAVTSLQYLDQRMRKEAYDVELMAQAGLIDVGAAGS